MTHRIGLQERPGDELQEGEESPYLFLLELHLSQHLGHLIPHQATSLHPDTPRHTQTHPDTPGLTVRLHVLHTHTHTLAHAHKHSQ